MVKLNEAGRTFYLTIDAGFYSYNNDGRIAKYIGIEIEEYIEKCKKEFNASVKYTETYYLNREDGERAREWLESILIANKLKEE